MKSLIKFFPVAVGVLALASCSNDDFFGSSSEDGKLELVATVAAPVGSDDGLITRSAITPAENVADYSTSWQTGDVFRVYDAALQKYDAFSYKAESKKITIDTESPKVTEYAKAIFPSESVSYAGWSADNDAVTATVYINPTITYEPAVKVGEKTAYVSNLPMWGDATMNEDHLSVNLNPLTAYADITVNGAEARYIRVISAVSGKNSAYFKTIAHDGAFDASDLCTNAPLTGYFDAMLVEDGKLVADLDAPLADKYGYVITVNMGTNAADEAHVFIPIVAQKYDNLIIQYSADGTANSWQELKTYPANTTVANNIVLRKDLVIGDPIETQDAKVSKFEDINARLTTFNNGSYAGVKVINIDLADGVAADAIKTSAGKQTITIPDFTEDKIINLNFDIDDTGYNLTIDNNNTKATVLNLKTIKGNMAVTINQGTYAADKNLVITGEINSTGTGENKRLIVGETGALTLGLDDFGPFKTDMNMYLSANVNALTIAAADGNTIPAIDGATAANTSAISIESGTVTTIGGTTAAKTAVTVEGDGKVTTLKTVGGNVTIQKGGNVTTTAVKDEKDGEGNVTTPANVTVGSDGANDASATATTITAETGAVAIKANATVASLTSAVTGVTKYITADASIGTLKLAGDAPKVILNGATAANKDVVKIESLQTTNANKKQTVTLESKDKAAVGNVTFAKSDDAISATSSITASKAADIKTDYIGTAGEIYTAAQLAGVTTGKNYKLMATTINANGKEWTPVKLNGTFDGNGKVIQGLKAPLFGTISGGTVKKLTLTSPNITSNKADQGALAQIVNGTVTIEEITVTDATIGAATGTANSKNIGGLVGRANGTLTFNKNKLTGTTAVKGYANVGGYIGNLEGGTVTFKAGKADGSYKSTIAFVKTFTATEGTDMNEGTFGNFIGSITGANANVTIGGADDNGADIAKFFDVTDESGHGVSESATAKANWNKNIKKVGDATKYYVGMKNAISLRVVNYEIGYSPVSALGTVILYGNITDELDNPIAVTINHINQYQ